MFKAQRSNAGWSCSEPRSPSLQFVPQPMTAGSTSRAAIRAASTATTLLKGEADMTTSALIWSAALQSSATLLAGGHGGMHWGVDEPSRDAAWPRSTVAMAGTARRVVELAAHIIMEMPDDDEAGVLRPPLRCSRIGMRMVKVSTSRSARPVINLQPPARVRKRPEARRAAARSSWTRSLSVVPPCTAR